jgi:hypothetical protein
MKGVLIPLGTALALIALAGCGENIPIEPDLPSRAPRNLSAYSAGDASVALSWAAPTDSADSSFTGFQVRYGSQVVDLPRTARNYPATGLATGESLFEVVAKRSSGTPESASIRWAPAARFDNATDLPEYIYLIPTASGFDAGDSLFNPTSLPLEASSQGRMDLYVQQTSETDTALAMKSARIYNAGWRPTVFSTVSHPSTSLNYAAKEFPAENTFNIYTQRLVTNTIYYAKTIGVDGSVHYARLHVRVVPGLSFPSRRVEIRVSLQRAAGVRSA